MQKYTRGIYLVVVGLLLLCGAVLQAQTITGAVNGTVTDPSGAVVAGAKVTATNVNTNVSSSVETNKDGAFNIRFLNVGQYKVVVEAPGFAIQTLGPFALEAGQEAGLNAKLSVEGSTTAVSVNETLVPLINTENATLGTTLDSKSIDAVPMIGRNFLTLTEFLPGAVQTNPGGNTGNSAVGRGGTQVSINGQRQQTNNYLLDGIEINETINNGIGYNPSPDALDQVKVVTLNANAEYGNVSGGDVLAITKSGTNAFHGSAYYYLQNYNMDANSWGNKHTATVTPKNSYTQSIWGGTIGGPIIKDKLFFFVDYTGARYHQGGLANSTVFSDKMRGLDSAGNYTGFADFSELLDPSIMCASGITPSNPCSGRLVQLYDPQNSNTPYAGNLVPITSPVAAYLFQHTNLYPRANQPVSYSANNNPISNNYRGLSKSRKYNDQGDIKIDWALSQKDRLSGRYSQSNAGSSSTNPLVITFPAVPTAPVKGFAINEVHTFSSNIVNELRLGYTRIQSLNAFPADSTGVFGNNGNGVLGITAASPLPGFTAQVFSPTSTQGQVTTTNGSQFTTLGNAATGTIYTDNIYTYADDLSILKGKHTMKMGAQFIRYQQNNYYPGNDGAEGTQAYTGQFTSIGTANQAGYAGADFVLGRVSYIGAGSLAGPSGQRQWRSAFFFQDDYRVSPNLTLNLGIRYEFDQPIYEVNNKALNVDLVNHRLLNAGQNGNSRALYSPVWTNIMPRVGFAYSATPRLVIRGGYGITTYMEGTGANLRMTLNPPYVTQYQDYKTDRNAAPFSVTQGAVTPFYNYNTLRAWDQKLRPQFIQVFSLTAEYQLTNSASFQIGYVGETGQHLITAGAANQYTRPCVIGGVVQKDPTSANCQASGGPGGTALHSPFHDMVVPNPVGGPGSTTLFPDIGTITLTASNSMYNYNALQATYRQRLSHGVTVTGNYTYSKALQNSIGFYGQTSITQSSPYAENFYDNHREYGPTGSDTRHGVNGIIGYELPFGRGRQFGANMNRVVDEVIGGWKVSMSGKAYTGFPINISATNNAYMRNNAQRANHYTQMKITGRNLQNWFGTDPSAFPCTAVGATTYTSGGNTNTCAYGQPADGTFGNASPQSERVPGFQQYDASASKDFRIIGEHSIGFRADASNVFNLTSLGNPNNAANSTSFGQITSVRSIPRSLQLSVRYLF
jgi:hypothetical protein